MAEENHKKEGVFEKSDELDAEQEEFLEPEEEQEPVVEREIEVDVGEHEADVYSDQDREILEESDEIAPWEEGFAEGAAGRGHLAKCAQCGKILSDKEDEIVEREYNGNMYRFCCDAHAKAGPKI